MKTKIILLLLALSIIPTAFADPINETKATYFPTVLPDSILYPFKMQWETWQLNHEYFLFADTNQSRIYNKTVAFIQRRMIDTQRMIDHGANINAINNSVAHMQIAIMKLEGSSKEDIQDFRKQIVLMKNKAPETHKKMVDATETMLNDEEIKARSDEIKHIIKDVNQTESDMEDKINAKAKELAEFASKNKHTIKIVGI